MYMHIFMYIYLYIFMYIYVKACICFMDIFWEVIAGANINLNWLIKIRSHLDKIEKEQEKVKQKKLSSLSRNSSFKKMVFERFN